MNLINHECTNEGRGRMKQKTVRLYFTVSATQREREGGREEREGERMNYNSRACECSYL